MNKKLIKDLIEILEYKERDELKKEQEQKWLNVGIDELVYVWERTYKIIVWGYAYDTKEHLLIEKKIELLEEALNKIERLEKVLSQYDNN